MAPKICRAKIFMGEGLLLPQREVSPSSPCNSLLDSTAVICLALFLVHSLSQHIGRAGQNTSDKYFFLSKYDALLKSKCFTEPSVATSFSLGCSLKAPVEVWEQKNLGVIKLGQHRYLRPIWTMSLANALVMKLQSQTMDRHNFLNSFKRGQLVVARTLGNTGNSCARKSF